MLNQLHAAWRARRVLLAGCADRQTLFMQTFLQELGAHPVRMHPGADSETLCRALCQGRIGTVIVPAAGAFAACGEPAAQLQALSRLLCEMREAGVPLLILCSDTSVYRACGGTRLVLETDAVGGETAGGLAQSLLESYAEGVSRGLAGDAVRALLIRHVPALGGSHPSARTADRWCASLLENEPMLVENPGECGVFLHPLDVCLGVLMLGAHFFLRDHRCTGIFNLCPGADSCTDNRSTALHFLRAHGGTKPAREACTRAPCPPLPCGAKARFLCGDCCRLSAQQALALHLTLYRAAANGSEREEIRRQTLDYLRSLPADAVPSSMQKKNALFPGKEGV